MSDIDKIRLASNGVEYQIRNRNRMGAYTPPFEKSMKGWTPSVTKYINVIDRLADNDSNVLSALNSNNNKLCIYDAQDWGDNNNDNVICIICPAFFITNQIPPITATIKFSPNQGSGTYIYGENIKNGELDLLIRSSESQLKDDDERYYKIYIIKVGNKKYVIK